MAERPAAETVAPAAVGYPAHWEADVVLRDGATAHVRPITPTDGDRLRRFHDSQSAESVFFRFFAPKPHLTDADVRRFTHVDHLQRVALVVTLGGEIVGVGRYEGLGGPGGDEPGGPGGTAEVAFNISDQHQGRGIGSILLEHLAAAARENGITRFEALVLPENSKMLAVFREAGYDLTHRLEDGVVSVEFALDPTERSVAVMLSREHRAEARSMHALLNPRSVVLVGVSSRRPHSLGRRLLAGLRAGGFTGVVHVVHHTADTVDGFAVHRSVDDLPGPLDLAVIAVPARDVRRIVADCARRGVRGVVVVSGGFAETGEEGRRLQAELVREARANGVRVLGPNSFGLLNTDPAVRLNVSIAPELPPAGGLALFSQSGALGVAVLDSAARRGLGLSSFVSAGNRADVSGNDCLQYWLDDERTEVVGLYLESVGNPRKFSRVARALATRKPLLVVKSGTSGYGVPPGHEILPSQAPAAAFDAMLRQAGVIRAESLHQLFDVAQVLRSQPLPAGDRVGIVGNSPALAALAADACQSWRLPLAGPPRWVPYDGPAADLAALVAEVQADPACDAVVACLAPPLSGGADSLARLVRSVPGKPTVACAMTSGFLSADGADADGPPVPALPLPEDAVRALAAVVRYAAWRRRDPGPAVPRSWERSPGPDQLVGPGVTGAATAHARRLVEDVLQRHPFGRELTPEEVAYLLQCYGLRVLPDGAVPSPGVACRITTTEDPLFGPIVSFAVAGEIADLLGDVAYRIAPLRQGDVVDLVGEVRAAPLLAGHGGRAPVDTGALHATVGRASVLAEDLPQVARLVLEPVVAHPGGCEVAGARVSVAPAPNRPDIGRRALSAAPG
jgi:acyl-CoA synthetase (NDP forming)/RimJ/RimL family protein N-acetyltransferase